MKQQGCPAIHAGWSGWGSLQWGNAIGEPYTGNPYVRFDEGTEVERPPPTLRGWGL